MKFHEGRLSDVAFKAVLLSTQVFVLTDRAAAPDGRWDDAASLLVLTSPTGVPLLALFTAPERATHWPAQAPEYAFGLLVEFRWLLHSSTSEVGMVINPGLPVALEIPAADLVQLRADSAAG